MIKYIIPLILFAKSMIFPDTTIIALEQFHQFFGNSGNIRTYVDTIIFPEAIPIAIIKLFNIILPTGIPPAPGKPSVIKKL